MSGRNHIKPPILILAGGKGTRLRQMAPDLPKPMVEVKGKPFLYWLIEHYVKSGYDHFLLSVGFKAEVFEAYPWKTMFPTCTIEIFTEKQALGTGGAVEWIFQQKKTLDSAWVINGDTLLPEPLPEPNTENEAFFTALEKKELFDAEPNLVVSGNYVVAVDSSRGHYFDAGAVFVTRAGIVRYQGKKPCSIQEVLAPSMQLKKVGYAVVPGTCYDIGTPERFKRFESYLC